MAGSLRPLSRRRPRSVLLSTILVQLLLLAAVFVRPSSCTRPLRRLPQPAGDGYSGSNGGAGIVHAVPHAQQPAVAAASSRLAMAMAGGSGSARAWLVLGMKPRGKAPPSAPSKRTN
ncbi:hypothetical protein ACP4OV_014436 [Aristida adscensionis]